MTVHDAPILIDVSRCAACLRCLRELCGEDGAAAPPGADPANGPDAAVRTHASAARPAATAASPAGAPGAAAAEVDERCPVGLLIALRRHARCCAEARAATEAAARAAHERIRAERARREESSRVRTRP